MWENGCKSAPVLSCAHIPRKTPRSKNKLLKDMKSVGEHTIRFLCTEQSVWLKNTHVKREKENGRSIWRALLLLRLVIFNCFFLQNFRARQFLKSSRVVSMWTYFKLSSLEKDWYSLQNFPYVVVNIRLILGNVWLKGYTWWNARIFQRPPQKKKKKNSSVGMERMTDVIFCSH